MKQTSSPFKRAIVPLFQTRRSLVFEGLCWLIIVGAVELAFAFSVGGDHLVYFAEGAASFFLIAVILLVWSSVRFEHLQFQKAAHGQ